MNLDLVTFSQPQKHPKEDPNLASTKKHKKQRNAMKINENVK